MSGEPVLLLVEDDFEHLRLTRYIFRTRNIPGVVHVTRDGQEALDFLYHRGVHRDAGKAPRPDLILLDLNIPRVNGREVLRIIKADPGLREIPVIVLSSSDREEDVLFARATGAAAYISKAAGFEQLAEELAGIHAHLPPPRQAGS